MLVLFLGFNFVLCYIRKLNTMKHKHCFCFKWPSFGYITIRMTHVGYSSLDVYSKKYICLFVALYTQVDTYGLNTYMHRHSKNTNII